LAYLLLNILEVISWIQKGPPAIEDGIINSGADLNKLNKTGYWLLCLFGICLLWTMQPAALDMTVEMTAGYDNNVTHSHDATGSGFGAYRISLEQPFLSQIKWLDGSVFTDVSYQDYFRADDNYQFKAGGFLGCSLADGRILPNLMYEAKFYRDDEAEWDEMDEHRLAGQLEWLVNARFTIGIQQAWVWQAYCNPVEIPCCGHSSLAEPQCTMSQNCHAGSGNPSGYGNMTGKQQESISRDDRLNQSSLKLTAYLSPDLEADMSLAHSRLSSSVETESYRENSISLSMEWFPDDLWKMSAMTSWKDADYSGSPDRSDSILTLGLSISRLIHPYEVFVHAEWLDNDSSLDAESYHQMVTQCGISLLF
jgi:hypothetical protein